MRSLLITLFFILTTLFSVQAQQTPAALTPLLNSYYGLKDALVNSDAITASGKANEFIKASNNVDIKTIPADKSAAFVSLQKKLVSDAAQMTATKDINKLRDYFAAFSLNFYSLAKTIKLSDQPVYWQYCPMKKTSWLSNDKAIKNPYYGKAMLTCGNVKETL